MAYDYGKQRPKKSLSRHMIWQAVKKTAKKALLFPAEHCHDIVEGLGLNVFSVDTEFVLIERDPEVAKKISKKCEALGLKKVKIINKCFGGEFHPGNGFDFMFFDFCGEATAEVYDAFHYAITPKTLTKDALLAFTFSIQGRVNPFHNWDPAMRSGFHRPASAMQMNSIKEISHGRWSCDKTLEALQCSSSYLTEFMIYKEIGPAAQMVCFAVDPAGIGKDTRNKHKHDDLFRYYLTQKLRLEVKEYFLDEIRRCEVEQLRTPYVAEHERLARRIRKIKRHIGYKPVINHIVKKAVTKDQKRKNMQAGGRKAWATRREKTYAVELAKLRKKRDKATSPGVKAAITRKVNNILNGK